MNLVDRYIPIQRGIAADKAMNIIDDYSPFDVELIYKDGSHKASEKNKRSYLNILSVILNIKNPDDFSMNELKDTINNRIKEWSYEFS